MMFCHINKYFKIIKPFGESCNSSVIGGWVENILENQLFFCVKRDSQCIKWAVLYWLLLKAGFGWQFFSKALAKLWIAR